MLKVLCPSIVVAGLLIVLSPSAAGQVRITEFMASNTATLADEDGDFSDWIEIQNTTDASVNLSNWGLTDSSGNPTRWLFPTTNLAPGGFMVIFASGKDRRVPGGKLHTNFKLSAGGEYLALSRPDLSVATEFAPQYPPQFPDVSYGIGTEVTTTTLIATNAPIRFLIPADASVDGVWTLTSFDDSGWQSGINGIGYETGIIDPQENSFAAKVLATGPEAYWRLNETSGPTAVNLGSGGVSDAGGFMGGMTLGGTGPRPPQFPNLETNNLAPIFDGTSGFVSGPYELVNNLPEFTLAGWIKPTTTPPGRTGLFGQNDTMEFGFISGSTIEIWTPAGQVDANYPYPLNQWHYLTAIGGNGLLSLYFDGGFVQSSTVGSGNFGESEYDFNIGGGGVFDGAGNYFTGQIDEVAVWFRALSTNELSGLVATNSGKVDFTPYLATDVRSQMYGSNASLYLRIPFTVTDPNAYNALSLLTRYDDGFAASLNGHPIAATNAPPAPVFNSMATTRNFDPQAVQWQAFDITAARQFLQPGTNVLAIQGLNIAATNTDFLQQVQLLAVTITNSGDANRYFSTPTPGGPNGTGAGDMGPILSGAGHFPNVPQVTDSITVTSLVARAFNDISNVTLHYRIMFNSEVAVPMNDSGTNSDVTANDGIWTAVIPAGVATAGQMIRYYVTANDVAANPSRWPIFPSPTSSEQYYGTVVADPSVHSDLPVVRLFIKTPSAADNQTGTQGSLFYLNELYDNVNIYVHGQSSVGWPKKSHNVEFPKDHQFLYQPGGVREKKVIFLSNYGDKSRIHTTLTYAISARSGGAALFSFPIRIHLNGPFWGVEDMVEHGDELFLERIGRDGNGALYKMYNNLSSASGNEKKTREFEDTSDLNTLVNSLDESRSLTNRALYAFDNLDLPQTASYFADMAISSSQDLGHKNYYLYRDSEGTGEWAIFPWDVDLTWGRNWLDSQGYFTDTIFTTNVLNFYDPAEQGKPANRLFDLFFGVSDFRQMYLRRLRTLMDTILMPVGTPTNSLVIEPLIRQYESLIKPPGVTPSDASLDYTAWGPTWGNTTYSQFPNDTERIISTYLPGRRGFLFSNTKATLNGDRIPALQPANTVIAIGSWDYRPVSGNPNEQYVELRNTNAYAVDVSRWRLTGAIEITLRPGTVIPAGRSLYLAANVNAFRARAASPHTGQAIFVQGPFSGYLNAQGNSPLILENDQGVLVDKNAFAGSSSATLFNAGNLAVLRVGDGAESLGSHGNSLFVDQYTTAGGLITTIGVPDDSASALVISGSASSEGALTRSADGRLLVLAGYNLALTNSASSLANSSSTNVPRALGVVDAAGGFGIVATTTNQYSGNNMRSGATDGRGNYWGAGANSGTYYFGDGPADMVQSTIAGSTVIQEIGGDLYFATSKVTPGIWRIPGAPVAAATPDVFVATGAGYSPYSFAFNPGFTTVYLADDTLAGNGGIQRWDLTNGVWLKSYTFSGLTNSGARGLAVDFSGAPAIIYATTAEAATNRLVSLTDTGSAATVITLATAGVNQLFRGVAFAPDTGLAPKIYRATPTGAGFTFSWTALLNRNYTVEFSDSLSAANWRNLTNMTATLPVQTVIDATVPAGAGRFYRVVLNP